MPFHSPVYDTLCLNRNYTRTDVFYILQLGYNEDMSSSSPPASSIGDEELEGAKPERYLYIFTDRVLGFDSVS